MKRGVKFFAAALVALAAGFAFIGCSDGSESGPHVLSVGDIVLSDFTVVTPNDITENRDDNVIPIAVIFDAENKLAVGLKTLYCGWCSETANARTSAVINGDMFDFKNNRQKISELGDFTAENYPAFFFCENYEVSESKHVDVDWYLPAIGNLEKINENKTVINSAFESVIHESSVFRDTYWSSNMTTDDSKNCARGYLFNGGGMRTREKMGWSNWACAICDLSDKLSD